MTPKTRGCLSSYKIHEQLVDGYILDVLRPVNREGSYQEKEYCIPTTSKNSDALLNTHFTIDDVDKLKLNEPGRQKLGRHSSPVCRHSIQSYILTYYRLRKREPFIDLGFHEGGPSFLHPQYPIAGWGRI